MEQNWDLREAHEKSLTEMEELKKFQSSTFDTIARRRLVEDQDTILELTGKIQELQNEISSHIRSAGRLVAVYAHKRKSSRDPGSVQETPSASERIRIEHSSTSGSPKIRPDEAATGEQAAL